MDKIELINIEKAGCSVRYNFSCSENLKKYFTGTDFYIVYPENTESVPDAV